MPTKIRQLQVMKSEFIELIVNYMRAPFTDTLICQI